LVQFSVCLGVFATAVPPDMHHPSSLVILGEEDVAKLVKEYEELLQGEESIGSFLEMSSDVRPTKVAELPAAFQAFLSKLETETGITITKAMQDDLLQKQSPWWVEVTSDSGCALFGFKPQGDLALAGTVATVQLDGVSKTVLNGKMIQRFLQPQPVMSRLSEQMIQERRCKYVAAVAEEPKLAQVSIRVERELLEGIAEGNVLECLDFFQRDLEKPFGTMAKGILQQMRRCFQEEPPSPTQPQWFDFKFASNGSIGRACWFMKPDGEGNFTVGHAISTSSYSPEAAALMDWLICEQLQ